MNTITYFAHAGHHNEEASVSGASTATFFIGIAGVAIVAAIVLIAFSRRKKAPVAELADEGDK